MDSSDDPWDWDVDRVVREFTTPNRSWTTIWDPNLLGDLQELGKKLIESEVDGKTLFLAVNDDFMQKELDLDKTKGFRLAFKARWIIEDAIAQFKRRSAKYKEIMRTRNLNSSQAPAYEDDSGEAADFPQTTAKEDGSMGDGGAGGAPSHDLRGDIHQSEQHLSIDAAVTNGLQSMQLSQQATAEGDASDLSSIIPLFQQAINSENDDPDALMDDAELSALLDADSEHSGQNLESAGPIMARSPQQPDPSAPPLDNSSVLALHDVFSQAHSIAAEIGAKKKPKRLAPTLVTTELDQHRDRQWHTEADNVIFNRPDRLEPRTVIIGHDGRKRLAPNLLSQTTSGAIISGGIANLQTARDIARAAKAKQARGKADLSKGYLGSVDMPVDDLFFSDAPLGSSCEQPEADDNFFQRAEGISTGRRLYVARRMRHFLMSQPRLVKKGGKSYVARRPYPENLVPINKPSSFILAQRSDDGNVMLTRENVAQWPELEPDHVKASANDNEHQATFNLPEGDFPLGGPSSYDNWDPDLVLRKWQHIPEDETLAAFGESGSENEYDSDTWREIEEERGTIEKPLCQSKRKPLTDEEVNEAMDEGMSLLQSRWHDLHLPKLDRKAYSLWMKSLGRRREQIAQLNLKLDLLVDDRIPKMRDEILKHVWTSQKQVRHQCRIMEQTIFDREEILWEISLLGQKTKPVKPDPLPKKEKRQSVDETQGNENHGGDSESIGLTSDEEADDEESDDFITDDEMDTADHVAMVEESLSESEVDEDESNDDDSAAAPDDDAMDIDEQLADIQMPGIPSTDTEAAYDEEEEEDVKVRTPSRRRHKMSALSRDFVESIDLTADTPPSSHGPLRRGSEAIDLSTPTKKDNSASASQLGAGVRQPSFSSRAQPATSAPISVSSDEEMVDVSEDEELLPPLDEPSRIAEYGIKHWQRRGDSDRMIATKLVKMTQTSREAIMEYFEAMAEMGGDQEIWKDMQSVLKASCDKKDSVQGLAKNQFRIVTGLARLFEVYIDGIDHYKVDRFDSRACRNIVENKEKWGEFLSLCRQVLGSFQPAAQPVVSQREDSATPRRPGARVRVRAVYQDPRALKLRNANEEKGVEQQRRREKLRRSLAAAPLRGENAKLIINETKMPEDGFIFVHPEIGHRIKDHQIEGIRFMWNQIVAKVGEEELQGCLLAHTMGLGKTMQVITLLVAIAEAANSDDPTVSRQIPAGLKTSKTLVLCPPGLLDNWIDELCLWVPDDVLPKLGQTFRKVCSDLSPADRLAEINAWHETGGILVMGFHMFRSIVSPAEAKNDDSDSKSPLPDFATASKQLLEGPNIVIADEAHQLKNATSKIHLATKKFRTKSRIALTGSPLSNNVEEYHSMIDWVAPNYLGPILEFRAKYVEPIQAGLYFNSTKYERRRSLKMLAVLEKNIKPKVSRCSSDVLKDDLPPKTEFIIQVPLTSLQDKLYRLYVEANEATPLAPDQLTKDGSIKQTTLWSWLGMLALLCNHPACFLRRLETPDKEAKKQAADPNVELPAMPKKLQEQLAIRVRSMMEEYDEVEMALKDSYKMLALSQILDACRAAGDKVLVFSQSRPTILFLENLFKRDGRKYAVLTGDTFISTRQGAVKNFNDSDEEIFLISTTAGGVGLNLHAANRVIIVDFKWSPAHEDQAIGRAYRLGQKKHVFVYRLVVGGTFEEKLQNQTVFKTQLAAQVVDNKKILANAVREQTDYLFVPRNVPQKDLSEFAGHDPLVLDKLLATRIGCRIRSIQMSEAFNRPDQEPLTAAEKNEVETVLAEEKLKRENPAAWKKQKDAVEAAQRSAAIAEFRRKQEEYNHASNVSGSAHSHRPPPPSSAALSINGAQQLLPNIMAPSPRPPGQVPRAQDPIMGSGTHMASEDNLDSQHLEGALNRDRYSPKLSGSDALRKRVQEQFTSILTRSIEQSIQHTPSLAEEYHNLNLQLDGNTTQLAELFAHEIDSAVLVQLNKKSRGDPEETWTSVVFARAADFLKRKMSDPATCATWIKDDRMRVKTIVKREMKGFFALPKALDPASPTPKKPRKMQSLNTEVAAPDRLSPSPQEGSSAQNVGQSFSLPSKEQELGQLSADVPAPQERLETSKPYVSETDDSDTDSVDQVLESPGTPPRSLRQRILEAAPVARLAALFGSDRADKSSSSQDNQDQRK